MQTKSGKKWSLSLQLEWNLTLNQLPKPGARSSPAWSSGPPSLQYPPCPDLPHTLQLSAIYLKRYQSPQSISQDLFQRSQRSRQWRTNDCVKTLRLNSKLSGWILFVRSLTRVSVEGEHTSSRFPWDCCSSGSEGEFLSFTSFHRAQGQHLKDVALLGSQTHQRGCGDAWEGEALPHFDLTLSLKIPTALSRSSLCTTRHSKSQAWKVDLQNPGLGRKRILQTTATKKNLDRYISSSSQRVKTNSKEKKITN